MDRLLSGEIHPMTEGAKTMSEVFELWKCGKSSKPKYLSCFCGMGGDSDGFALEGFDVMGIDIVDAPKMLGYKHKFIQADMLTLKGSDFKGFDVVWGSPPCRDFSEIGNVFGKTWKRPQDPNNGMILVRAYLEFVKKAKPKFWIMENVPGLIKHFEKPRFKTTLGDKNMARCFWGNFPNFLMPKTADLTVYHHFYESKSGKRKKVEGRIVGIQGKYRQWERAKIPLPCSQAFAKACKLCWNVY